MTLCYNGASSVMGDNVNVGKEYTTGIVQVGPLLAKEMLSKLHPRQRRPSSNEVDRFAVDMLNGSWTINGQAILIGNDGLLYDGQHRLRAVVQSGMTVPMLITRGDFDFTTIDLGRVRSIAFVTGKSHSGVATIRALRAAELGAPWEHAGLSPSVIAETESHHAEALSQLSGVRVLSGIVAATAWAWPLDGEACRTFFVGVHTGAMLAMGDAAYAMRGWVSRNPSNSSRYVFLAACSAIRAHLDERKAVKVTDARDAYYDLTSRRRGKKIPFTPMIRKDAEISGK